jgi:hypothetical protein
MTRPPAEPTFPPLAEALDRWRRADEAFARARTSAERGSAMVQQLQALDAVHQLSEVELLLGDSSRVRFVEEGIWSPDEALDRLVLVPFDDRARSLRALAPILPDELLGRALDMATRPGWGDDARWHANEELTQALAARMASAEPRERAITAHGAGARDAEPPPAAAGPPGASRRAPRFEALLQIAQRLRAAPRATVLRWAVADRERRGGLAAPLDLARVAALAEGPERDALVAVIEPRLGELETSDRLAALAALMPGATPAAAIDLARRGFASIAGGKTKMPDAKAFFEAIPPHAWAGLGRADWEPALDAGGFQGGWARILKWVPYDAGLLAVSDLPEEARRLLEERGLPALLGESAYERLRTGAAIVHALSPAGRAQLAASLLALDAATWRESAASVAPIARAMGDEDLERLSRTLDEPDPEGESRAEAGLAEAWAARGRLDRATAIVDRVPDDDQRAEARVGVAIAAEDAVALVPLFDPALSLRVYRRAIDAVVRWVGEGRDPAIADALAARVHENPAGSDRLDAWAALWPALSPRARAELAPQIERAVEAVLTDDDLCDDSLCAIADVLPEKLLERIWVARAFASAYRHALALFEKRFCEFMIQDNHRHSCVLRFLQALGGDEALFEHATALAHVDSRGDAPR